MVPLNKASEMYSRSKIQLEKFEKDKALEKFTILFNRETNLAAQNGEFGVYIPKESISSKYRKEILTMLEENGYDVQTSPILSSYLISWSNAEEDDE